MTNDLQDYLNNYDLKNQNNVDKFNEIKDDNKEISDNIYKTLKLGEFLAKKKNIQNFENLKKETIFKDIFFQYRNKGYKIPNLSSKKNLFKPSALLVENTNLKHYFRNKKKEDKLTLDKETHFISKLNNQIYDRLKDLNVKVDPSKYKSLESVKIEKENLNTIEEEIKNPSYLTTLKIDNNNIHNENELIKENIKSKDDKFQMHIKNFERNNKLISKQIPDKKIDKKKTSYDEFLKRISKPKKTSFKILTENLIPTSPVIFINKFLHKSSFNLCNSNSELPTFGKDVLFSTKNSRGKISTAYSTTNKLIDDSRDIYSSKSTRGHSIFSNSITSGFELKKKKSENSNNLNVIYFLKIFQEKSYF